MGINKAKHHTIACRCNYVVPNVRFVYRTGKKIIHESNELKIEIQCQASTVLLTVQYTFFDFRFFLFNSNVNRKDPVAHRNEDLPAHSEQIAHSVERREKPLRNTSTTRGKQALLIGTRSSVYRYCFNRPASTEKDKGKLVVV